jgi:hypothetical protein
MNPENCKDIINVFSEKIIESIDSMDLKDIDETKKRIEIIKEKLGQITTSHPQAEDIGVSGAVAADSDDDSVEGNSGGKRRRKRRVRKSKKNKKRSYRRKTNKRG